MKTVQIRNVPDDVHAELRARAAAAGVSLSEYLLRVAIREVERPSVADVLLRNSRREWAVDDGRASAVLRALREEEI
jgi:antitoxin FitA